VDKKVCKEIFRMLLFFCHTKNNVAKNLTTFFFFFFFFCKTGEGKNRWGQIGETVSFSAIWLGDGDRQE
jgi:hypothetical protein